MARGYGSFEKKLSGLLGLNHNSLIISISELIHDSGNHLIWSFFSLYVLGIGGTVQVLGLYTLITGLSSLIFFPLAGYLSDKYGRKKPVVYGGFLVALGPLLIAFASNWMQLIPGLLLNAVDQGIWTSRQALFTDNIDPRHRGRSLASFYTIMSLTSSFLPTLGGMFLDSMGLINGFRIGLCFTSLMRLIQSTVNAVYLEDVKPSEPVVRAKISFSGLKQTGLELMEPVLKNRRFQILLLGQIIASFGFGLVNQYIVIYAVDILGLSKTQWGLVTSSSNLLNNILRIPIGAAVDIIECRRGYILGIIIQAAFPSLFVLSSGFYYIIILYTFNSIGGAFTQMGREALLAEMSSIKDRGVILGSFASIAGYQGVIGSLSPALGAYIWENYGSSYPFYLTTLFRLVAALFFMRAVKKKAL